MPAQGLSIQALRANIQNYLPDYSGYEDASKRADTDRRLRDHVSAEITDLSSKLENAVQWLENAGSGAVARAIEKVRHKLGVINDGLGEGDLQSGALFLAEQVDDATLSQLYSYDLSILRRVAELRDEVAGMNLAEIDPESSDETLTILHDLVDGLSQDIFERDTLLEGESESEY